jgi:hypothetical protein
MNTRPSTSDARVVIVGVIVILAFCAATGFTQATSEQLADTPLDLILIVDTSATMVGKAGGMNIFPQVKKTMKDLVDIGKQGDNVVLITYDAGVRVYPTATIGTENDKDSLKNVIDSLNADGPWTYTAAAVERGLAEANRLDNVEGISKHTKLILLLTDGLNDPPPGLTDAGKIKLEEIVRPYTGKLWFVWQIQLGPQVDHAVDAAFGAAGFSNYRQVKTTPSDLDHLRNRVVQEVKPTNPGQLSTDKQALSTSRADIGKEKEPGPVAGDAEKGHRFPMLALIFAASAGSAAIAGIVLWNRRRLYPAGTLRYWRRGELPHEYDLGATKKRNHRLGEPGSDIAIVGVTRGFVRISAESIDGEILPVVEAGNGIDVKFKGNRVDRLELHDRDEFEIGEYEIQYLGEVSGRL